jgi:hypothetical protein
LLERGVGSIRMGTTLGARRMSVIAFDLAVQDIEKEEVRFVDAVGRLLRGELP